MSAASRHLHALATHLEDLRDGAAGELDRHGAPVYNAWELWDRAADMARRTADDSTWAARWQYTRERISQWWEDQR